MQQGWAWTPQSERESDPQPCPTCHLTRGTLLQPRFLKWDVGVMRPLGLQHHLGELNQINAGKALRTVPGTQ